MANVIDSLTLGGKTGVLSIPYTTCGTAAGTAAKTASVTNFSLETGAQVRVKFTYANTVANPTLNINSSGAKAIYWHGAALPSAQYWAAGAVLDFVYNGSQWELVSVANDNNTTYTLSSLGAAPTASPTFTGTPKAPTAAAGTNTTQIATTAFVTNGLASKLELSEKTITLPSGRTWMNMAYGDGIFVAVANSSSIAAYSYDGFEWYESTLPSFCNSRLPVTYGDGKFVVIEQGGANVAYSSDGISWNSTTMPISARWHSVTYGGGKFVAIPNTDTNNNDCNFVAYSTDGISWSTATLPISGSWNSITYGGGKFVVTPHSGGTVVYSTDGITWNSVTYADESVFGPVTYGDGKFVTITSVTSSNRAAYSEDGISWTTTTLPVSSTWNSVTYGDGIFVGISSGYNYAVYSADGINWKSAILPLSAYWKGITYGNGKFISCNTGSGAVYSTDGISWKNTRPAIISKGTDVTAQIANRIAPTDAVPTAGSSNLITSGAVYDSQVKITSSTQDITAGSTLLADGELYLVYE